MSENYPISTGELVVIALKAVVKETAKSLPVVAQIMGASEAVFNKIEQNRVNLLITELARRVENIEKRITEPRSAEIVLFACELARSDPLIGEKTADAAGIIKSLMTNTDTGMDAVVEILDNLRKLNSSDLKILYRFKNSELTILTMPDVLDVQPGYDHNEIIIKYKNKMEEILPNIMRLEALGLLFRVSTKLQIGGMVLDIGSLSEELRKSVQLTPQGTRLISQLP
jgi:glutaredoxin 2